MIAPINASNPDEEQQLRKKYEEVLSLDKPVKEMDLIRLSNRSYPTVMVYDDDIWINRIEASKTANMALSPEEVGVLDSIFLDIKDGVKGYPLFINGRPGSGKSTVLQYLFAEHLYYHLSRPHKERLPYPPIYLTYNEKLLGRAKETITDILKCDSKKVMDKPIDLENVAIKKVFDQSFGHFHEFLYSLLPEDGKNKLCKEKYVSYSTFRQMWNDKFSKSPDPEIRQISPELAWHVIRTYIKGMRQEGSDYFDIESYQDELPRDQKTVTVEKFQQIYQLWESWYCPLCENDGYWDDQDLTWNVLTIENDDLSCYPGIFCDESQDFTYIELDLIYRLSLFSQRNIPPYLLPRVPFAFAGDPFQTLNPTGFNWQATQANFHDKIVRQLDKSGLTKLQINFRELEFNYRSTINIVQFCNLIQLLRGVAFEIPGLVPQMPWFNQVTYPPLYFEDTDQVGQEFLQKQAELVIIPPCQEGEENQYVINDPFLRTVALDENGDLVRNIQSPIRAKGLDFQRVVLYKFGQECIEKYPKLITILNKENPPTLTKDEELPLEYFINRLYVAASRPQRVLFIIDTKNGLEKFWKFAKDIDLRLLQERYRNGDKWNIDYLVKIQPGRRENLEQDRDNPRELADQFFKDGKEKRDVYQLKQAIINYRACTPPLEDKAMLSQALIYEFDGDNQKAGDTYAAMGASDEARRCYWRAASFKDLIKLGSRDSRQVNTIEHRAAFYQLGQKSFNECKGFLDNLFQLLFDDADIKAKVAVDRVWTMMINNLVQQFAKHANPQNQNKEWKAILAELLQLKNTGANIEVPVDMAKIAYYAGDYQISRDFLNNLRSTVAQSSDWTIRVYAETTPYPQNLDFYSNLGDWKKILEEYKKYPHTELKQQQIDKILIAFEKVGELEGALTFVRKYPSVKRYGRLIQMSLNAQSNELAQKLALSLFADFLKNGQWTEAINFASRGQIEGLDLTRTIQDSAIDDIWRNTQLISLLARSDQLSSEASVSEKDKISKYLSRALLRGKQPSMYVGLTIPEIGSAIERANKFNDILEFYMRVSKGDWQGSIRDIRFARLRSILCKRRQIQSMDNPKARSRAEREMNDLMLEWDIKETELAHQPTFPILKDNELDEDLESISPVSEICATTNKGRGNYHFLWQTTIHM